MVDYARDRRRLTARTAMSIADLPLIDAARLDAVLGRRGAIDALDDALRTGVAPGHTPARTIVGVAAGELLIMPSEVGGFVGTKLVSVTTPPVAGVPRVQGIYVLCDARTLTPVALIDGPALTDLRTAAVSAVAVRHLTAGPVRRAVVFGAGPQAYAHARALAALGDGEPEVTVVSRTRSRAEELAARLPAARVADSAAEALGAADVVVCATTASEPLFDSALLAPEATVVAIGSHLSTGREVDTELVRRAIVIVESRDSALREAGDIVLAVADGVPESEAITAELGELTRGEVAPAAGRPRLFKGVGEAWSDAVVAAAAFLALGRR